MTIDWSHSFFRGLVAESVPLLFPPEVTAQEIAGLARTLAPMPGARILDVPCGDGRLALGLAATGLRLTGVDVCSELVSRAAQAASERGLDARFVVGDMRELAFDAEFESAFCMGNSFAYFEDEANAAFLGGVARALVPGGRFVLDALCAETLLPHLQERKWFRLGDILFLSATTYDPTTATATTDYTLSRGDGREDKTARYRVYGVRQLIELLQAAGFSAVVPTSDLDGTPFRFGARRLFLLATK